MNSKTSLYIALGAIILSTLSCSPIDKKPKNSVQETFEFAESQLTLAIQEVEAIKVAESTEKQEERKNSSRGPLIGAHTIAPDGSLQLVSAADWTSGFFPGTLWYLYEYTGDKKWRNEARKYTAPLEREKTNGTTHDMGFKVYCSFGNGYRLTDDQRYKDILIESAYTLASRYNPTVKAIRSWDHSRSLWDYSVIIDNMINLELLFWASDQTKDSTLYNIAENHAITTMKNHFREDYGTYHVLDYDTITGNVVKKETHQGFAHESTWSRGEAWALYGFTMCYRETKNADFLDLAKNVSNFIFTNPNLPEDLIPYWDFDAPGIPNEPRDASAAAVIASALYELSLYDLKNAGLHKQRADDMLDNLSKNYRAKAGGDHGFILQHSTGAKMFDREVDVPLSYADYYFLEALLRKQKIENMGKIF